MKNTKDKYITGGTAFALTVNLLLFAVKLYIGLSLNSISIYSDGINNLFDGLSGGLALGCLLFLSADKSLISKALVRNCENLLSFIMSVIVGIAGFSFAYSSLERLMYPTPVWYRKKYLYILIATALVKLLMHFVFKTLDKKTSSPVIRVMAFDSLLDFFVTSVTVMTLLASKHGSYSFDAFCGIGISIVILISAVKMVISSAGKLIGFVPKAKREALEAMLTQQVGEENLKDISLLCGGEEAEAIAEISARTTVSEEALAKIRNETGITVHIIYRKENTDILCETEE